MRRKILLPTDFSKNAWHAIKYAVALYKNDDCDFYLLNVFSDRGNYFENLKKLVPNTKDNVAEKQLSEKGLAKTMEMLTLLHVEDSKHHFKLLSISGSPLEVIKDVVEQKDIELIIMGTKGTTNSKKIAYGSTAINVMEKVRNCPTIAIPEEAKQNLPKEIVFPTSYQTHYKKREMNILVDLAKKMDANIAILHVARENELNENKKKRKRMLQEIFEEIKFTFHEISNYPLESAVNIFIESRNSDMVAFINKKHSYFGSVLTQPLVKGLGFNSTVPILVMHDLRN